MAYVKYYFKEVQEEMIWAKENGAWVQLPVPDEIAINNEIIWSSNTGRSSTGKMIGDVIAEKNTFSISWAGIRLSSEYKKIKKALVAGFFPIKIQIDEDSIEIKAYRGTLSARSRGKLADGFYYYDSISVDIVEQ